MQYICRNKKCQRIFLDESPFDSCLGVQKWKYCPQCVEAGFVNPDVRPISEAKKNQIINMHRAKKLKRSI